MVQIVNVLEPLHCLVQIEVNFSQIKMLNRPSTINDNAINRLPQKDYNALLDGSPTVAETAIQHKSSGNPSGADAVSIKPVDYQWLRK